MNEHNKKLLMFIKGEDFYFLTYNILLILKSLNCIDTRIFRDYRKLPFLIEIISNNKLVRIIDHYKDNRKLLNVYDKEILIKSYYDGLNNIREIFRLIFILEEREIIQLNHSDNILCMSLPKSIIKTEFFNTDYFQSELNNIEILKRNINRISILKYDSLLRSIYGEIGVKLWET